MTVKKASVKRALAIILSILAIAAAVAGCNKGGKNKMVLLGNYTRVSDVPAADLSAVDAEYQHREPVKGETVATLHTNYGDISIRFFPEAAPLAVNSFIALSKNEKYNDTIFHRVINNFMIQGGDYTRFNGTGGESAYGEEFDLEICENLSNIEGSVAMANRGPGTNGSQFYINQVDNTYLDGRYTVFGQVFDGMDTVNDIAQAETDYNDRPVNDVVLESVEIYEYE